MSYARFSTDDVYVFLTALNGEDCLECCGCWLGPTKWREPDSIIKEGFWVTQSQRFATTVAMLAHLDEHRAAGHDVSDDVYRGLLADEAENDALMNPTALNNLTPKADG